MTDKNTVFHQNLSLNLKGNLMDLSSPKVMAILNVTPDSFYDGGLNNTPASALEKAGEYLSEGADMIDVGAYSSRPGAAHISEKLELERLIPVIRALVAEFPQAIISVDTFRSGVAAAAINEGAHIINDISAGAMDPEMYQTVASLRAPYIMMHMRGTPATMSTDIVYEDLCPDICRYFAEKVALARAAGILDIIIDPGFGFAKTLDQNYELLKCLDHFRIMGLPVLAGLSRKSMIYKLLGTGPEDALNGTTAANVIALLKGASILRVHDVKAAREAIKIAGKVM